MWLRITQLKRFLNSCPQYMNIMMMSAAHTHTHAELRNAMRLCRWQLSAGWHTDQLLRAELWVWSAWHQINTTSALTCTVRVGAYAAGEREVLSHAGRWESGTDVPLFVWEAALKITDGQKMFPHVDMHNCFKKNKQKNPCKFIICTLSSTPWSSYS